MKEVWIIDSVRTPRGLGKKDKGALSNIHPQRLLSTVLPTPIYKEHLICCLF